MPRCIRRTVVDPRWSPARARIWAIFTFQSVGQRILRRFTRWTTKSGNLFALVTAYLWLMIGARQDWLMRHVHRCITAVEDSNDPVYRFHTFLTDARTGEQLRLFKWVRATPIFTIVIPGMTFFTWLILLSLSIIDYQARWLWWLIIPFALGGATLLSSYLRDKPQITEGAIKALYAEVEK